MTRTFRRLSVVLVATAGALSLASHRYVSTVTHTKATLETPETSAPPRSHHRGLRLRVDDPTSREYKEWLGNLKEANLTDDEVLGFLESDLSGAQKNAMFEDHLKASAGPDSIANPQKWQRYLSRAVFSSDFDLDLGGKAGRVLGHVSSQDELATLEEGYRRNGSEMKPGNKLAIVTASQNSDFISEVLHNDKESIDVRDRAVERLSELGQMDSLREIAATTSQADPALKVTSLGSLAEKSENVDELNKVVELSKGQSGNDSFGRNPRSVAQVGVSESKVDGKSSVLFAEWEVAIRATQGEPSSGSEAKLVHALVTGKSLSHAIWTENNAATAARLIDDRLAPLIRGLLGEQRPGPALQVIAEFASDFLGACTQRSSDACLVPGDRRMVFRVELSVSIRPRLAGTDLEFYSTQLGG